MSPEAYLEMAEVESRHWWFSGRRAILSQLIVSLDLQPKARILEIGCGTGGNLAMLSSFGEVSAMEMDAVARSIALEKTAGRFDIRPGCCPAEMPFTNEKFDLVCLFDVLEHIDQDVKTLAAVKNLLDEGGRILVTVPANKWLWGPHDEFLHHKRRYTADELSAKIVAAGLTPVRISSFNTFLFPIAAIVRLKERLLRNTKAAGSGVPSSLVNKIFASVFGAERFFLKRANLPFGVSLLGIVKAAPTK